MRDKVPILKEDDKMRNILSKYKLIKVKRQPYSLKRLLTKAKFTSNNAALKVTKCNRSNCGLCILLLEGHTFTFKCGKKNFNTHGNMSCDVKNVIYVMKCRGCGEEYIGETGNLLRQRVTIYNQKIRDPITSMFKVSEHISNCVNAMTPKYNFFFSVL